MLRITKAEMPGLFLIWCIFSELYTISRVAQSLAVDDAAKLQVPENSSRNDTIDELIDGSDETNQNNTEPTPLSAANTTSSDFSNVTQKSNPFIVSTLLEYSALSWLKNEYVMSIVIPIAAGIGSGLLLIILLNICRCARAKCQKSYNKNRNLPVHIKQMKLADRMKLLAESSDEEF